MFLRLPNIFMSCSPCGGSSSAVTDASTALSNLINPQYSPQLTSLMRALDQVDIKFRMDDIDIEVEWRTSQFKSKPIPYNQKPQGTTVVVTQTPLYFEENNPYVYDLHAPSPEGGICAPTSLCKEPPTNKLPGDTYQTFTYRAVGTAWETPLVCLKDLLFYENGIETLRNFLSNVEKSPMSFYSSYIRNEIWNISEKYLLAATTAGMLWNSPDRVSRRVAPNITDFRTSAGNVNADAGIPTVAGLQILKYTLETFLGSGYTSLKVNGKSPLMMVTPEPDMFSVMLNSTCAPCSFVQGGAGYKMFTFQLIDQLPFAYKVDNCWFRGSFDVAGEFVRIPAKIFVPQNGGMSLRPNPAWLAAPYGVLTFMTANPFFYRSFEPLPRMPSQVPAESMRFLRPRFQYSPLLEKCNYNRGIVGWRAEDEFAFEPTGEPVISIIFRRDAQASYIREALGGECPTILETCEVPIPVTCSTPEILGCCAVPGAVLGTDPAIDYRDTGYTITYDSDIVTLMGWDVADLEDGGTIAAQFKTLKGVFDVVVVAVNSTGTQVTFYVDPTQHIGGHFCCLDQLVGFVLIAAAENCQVDIDLSCDPFDPTQFIGRLSAPLDAVATDEVTVFFDGSCGTAFSALATLDAINNNLLRVTLSFTAADFPDGVPCDSAVSICATDTVGCDACVPADPAPCAPDDVTPIPGGNVPGVDILSVEGGVGAKSAKKKGRPAKAAKAEDAAE